MNVVPFSDFANDRQIQAHQLGLPRVILEGGDDVRLFTEWFGHLNEELEFVEAKQVGPGGGCTGVGPAVRISREEDGIPAVGIVDRDAIHRTHRWATMFETDDAVFAREARTESIYTTTLWEVEAYLIRPELLSEWVSAQARRLPSATDVRNEAVSRTIEECEALLSATPFYGAAHALGTVRVPPAHFHSTPHSDLASACANHDASQDPDHQQIAAEIEALIASIRASAPASGPERLLFLLRYVDTKRLLARLGHRLELRENAHWGLQSLMSGRGLRPEELEIFLIDTAERFAA